jgi:ferritin-like metal-binding protein YciE
MEPHPALELRQKTLDGRTNPAIVNSLQPGDKIMGLFFNKQLNTLEDLLALELDDLYDAEQRLCVALPKMAEAAHCEALKQAFENHTAQTQRHVSRLEQIFVFTGRTSNRETCDAMKGLISEGADIIDATGSPEVKDAALIGAAQRVEHYEMAAYGTARTFAQHLGLDDVVRLLQATLDEERETDEQLTALAEQEINSRAEQSV